MGAAATLHHYTFLNSLDCYFKKELLMQYMQLVSVRFWALNIMVMISICIENRIFQSNMDQGEQTCHPSEATEPQTDSNIKEGSLPRNHPDHHIIKVCSLLEIDFSLLLFCIFRQSIVQSSLTILCQIYPYFWHILSRMLEMPNMENYSFLAYTIMMACVLWCLG